MEFHPGNDKRATKLHMFSSHRLCFNHFFADAHRHPRFRDAELPLLLAVFPDFQISAKNATRLARIVLRDSIGFRRCTGALAFKSSAKNEPADMSGM
ncbi:hypothetical protein [Roseibium sp.]|uniref:hypothetical protein n=1 Tax=Roseibium sp. TaxID=1936156 RepID=UPI003BAA0FE5